jgi:hypothetical protein
VAIKSYGDSGQAGLEQIARLHGTAAINGLKKKDFCGINNLSRPSKR